VRHPILGGGCSMCLDGDFTEATSRDAFSDNLSSIFCEAAR